MGRLPRESIVVSLELEARLQQQLQDCVTHADAAGARSLVATVEQWLKLVQDCAERDPTLVSKAEAVAVAHRWGRELTELMMKVPALDADVAARVVALIASFPKTVPGAEKYKLTWNAVFEFDAQWRHDLAHFVGRPDLSFLEIGASEGRATTWLLEHVLTHGTSQITCLDFFAGPAGARFDHNIAAAGGHGRVRKLAGDLRQTLRTLPLATFDFVYVDAAARSEDQIVDAVLGWGVLKAGGIMTFDDYGGPPDWGPGVTRATDAFLAAHADRYDELYRGFQLTIKKRA